MSDMTMCNCCILDGIRKRARRDGKAVTVMSDAGWGLGGRNVYVHPKGTRMSSLDGGEDGSRKRYRVAWMMEIPKRCCC